LEGFLEPKESFWSRWGMTTALSAFRSDVQAAIADPDVETIYIYCDSPGGIALGNQEAADVLFEAGKQKETVGVGEGLVASAAYFIYSACNQKVATPSTLIGSIGSMRIHGESSIANAEYGDTFTVFSFGQHKTDGNEFEPLTEQARETVQAGVDTFGTQFVNAVARHQKISFADVMENYGQGKVFIAGEALQRGMIDQIGTFNISTGRIKAEQDSTTSSISQNTATEQKPVAKTDRRTESPTTKKTISSGDSTNPIEVSRMKFSEKIVCTFVAFGLIKSATASDDVIEAAFSAFCNARGVDMPAADDDAAIMAIVNPAAKQTASTPPQTPTQPSPQPIAQSVELIATETREVERDRRISALSGAASTLKNFGFELSATDLSTAVDSEESTDAIISKWHSAASNANASGDGRLPSQQIAFTADSHDKFNNEATNRLLQLAGCKAQVDSESVSSMRNWSAKDIFQASMDRMGMPHQIGGDYDLDFQRAQLRGMNQVGETRLPESSSVTGYTTPSDLSAVIGRTVQVMFDTAMDLKETTFREWTGQLPDSDSLDPKALVAISSASTLDEVIGTQAAKEFAFEQELVGNAYFNQFHNFVPVSFEMSYGNNIAIFYEKIAAMGEAIPLTDQDLVLKILHSSETISDTGVALFHANRGNLFTGGSAGVPSLAQAEAHENAFMNRVGVGTNARRLNLRPAIALVPTGQKLAAKQTYNDPATFAEMVSKQTDATKNPHAGGGVKVITEPSLADYSATAWYTFTDPSRHPAIVRMYLQGFGPGGRRTQSVDTDRRCVKYHIQHVVGAGVKNARYVNKDDGA